nr:hypothetical protein [Aeromicrobium sp.]
MGNATIPGEKGAGKLSDLDAGAWVGHALDQTLVPVKGGARVEMKQAERVVSHDRAVIIVTVTVTAAERPDDAATTLADTVLQGYLERLG